MSGSSSAAVLPAGLEGRVRAAAEGDRQAFAELIDQSRSVVCAIAMAIVRDPDLSHDVAQDVYLAVWRDLRQLRRPASFLSWVRQLTRHRARHVLRSERRRTRRLLARDSDALIAAAVDPRPDAGRQVLADEQRRVVAEVLDGVPDEAREVLTLFYREGGSVAQVAWLLGLSQPAVRKRLSRARERVRADVLERFSAAARRSAPGAGFTAAVLAALTVAAPASAATGAAAASVVGAGAGKSFFAKLLVLGGGALAGAAGGIAGVVLGTRQVRRQARDERERRALDRFGWVNVGWVLCAALSFSAVARWAEGPVGSIAVYVVFLLGLAFCQQVWLPRILRRRFALEMQEDPERALRVRARERRMAILGWTLGLVFGTAGLVAGLWFSS